MFAVFEAIKSTSQKKMHKRKTLTRICFNIKNQTFSSLDPSFLIIAKISTLLTSLKKTIGIINAIEENVVIIVFMDLYL